ncbi:MATE family efflux transporter [Clostridium cylindrosporum]|uniref:Multidrug export protein MepA n=1 Tax=Clostridium cylindrosporum DSM 605 TaxID=1121307 RepID=A0A0J8DEC0_CLOCY|nr:MATE family efflux transporter [Clostridium cylindrosporum]KMT22538.1 multidrug export protein MepA [Clostridium cylindrosporum DSM 605]
MTEKDSLQLMGTENIGKLLVKFSVPAIIGLIVNALYNIVDRIFVGQGVNILALSGITIAFPVMNVIIAFGMLVGIGATALISIRLGQGKKDEAEKILGNAISLTVILSLILTVIGIAFLEPILVLFGGKGEVLTYAKDYTLIILIGTVLNNLSFGINSIIRADGSPKMAMFTMIIGAVINAILNPIFIFGLGLGIQGSALATVISQAISTVWVLMYFRSSKSLLKIRKENLKPDFHIIRSTFAIGMSPFSMQIAASVITVILNKQLVNYGDNISVAVMGVINSIVLLLLMPIFGINQGVQPILGYNFGAKKYDRVKEALKLAIISATIISTLGYILVAVFPGVIMSTFADKSNTAVLNEFISQGTFVLRVYLCMLPIVGFQIVSSVYFQSVGKAGYSMFLSLSRQVIILLPLLIIMPTIWGLHGIFIAGPTSDFLSSLITAVLLIRDLRKLGNREEAAAS